MVEFARPWQEILLQERRPRRDWFVKKHDRGEDGAPSVPGMGQDLLPERRQPEEVTTTVAKRKGEAARLA